MTRLADELASRKLVVFLGTGGVGKTTIAAASALESARRGRRTLVLTIDPARRLADALGVKIGAKPAPVRENLDAMMLDTKQSLDDLITRYAPSPETLKRIFASRFYAQLSDAFAGSEEFVAMGALHDLHVDGRYDVIVVDTPPSKHAVDFLSVNQKLLRVFGSGIVKYLFKPTRFMRLGGGYVAQALAKWTSAEYLEEVAEFMMTFDQMFMDMEVRVRTMDRLMTDPSLTSVNLVTAAEDESVPMTVALAREVEAIGLPVAAVIVNRYYPRLPGLDALPAAPPPAVAAAVAHATGASEEAARAFVAEGMLAARFYDRLATQNARNRERLSRDLEAPFAHVPALAGSVHDLAGLERVRAHLFRTAH